MAGLPGGGASDIAHMIGAHLVTASGLTIAGIDLWVMIIVIGAPAMLLQFVHERVATRGSTGPMTVGAALLTAVVTAVVTVLAFDVGMGGWMLLLHFNELMPRATDASFWLLMQLGSVTGYPAVVQWLTHLGRVSSHLDLIPLGGTVGA